MIQSQVEQDVARRFSLGNGQASGQGDPAMRRARGLGWFSVGLGLAQVMAPRMLSRLVVGTDGVKRRRTMQAIGLRELAAGVNLLRQPRDSRWLWARVAGDVMDLALLGSAFRSRKAHPTRLATSIAAVVGVAALDYYTGKQISRQRRLEQEAGRRVTRAVTILRPPEELYRYWRNLPNLARFMQSVESIQELDGLRSRWRVRTAKGKKLEWDAEITAEEPNQRLAWRSLPGAKVPNSGEVRFVRAPGGRGTEVRLSMDYNAPGGSVGAAFAKLFAKGVEYQVDRDLRSFKQVIEAGERVLSDATVVPGPHPARPPEQRELDKSLSAKGGL
jgi:uncharacterized membrane protein